MKPADWKRVIETLSWAGGSVRLDCDGYELELRVVPHRPLSYVILPYVNGRLTADWVVQDCEERRRFFRPYERFVYPEKHRRALLQIYGGKRASKAKRDEINAKVVCHDWCWRSPLPLKRHLIANNDSITFVRATVFGLPEGFQLRSGGGRS